MAHLRRTLPLILQLKLKYLCLAHRKHLTRPTCERLQARGKNQELFATTYPLFNFTSSFLPLCSIKETSIQTQVRWFFGTPVHHLLGLLAFWIALFPQPLDTSSLNWWISLSCGKQYELGLSNKFWWGQIRALQLVASWLQLGSFPVRPYQLPGRLVLRIFPSEFSKAALLPQHLAVGARNQHLDTDGLSTRVSVSSWYSQKLYSPPFGDFFSPE